MNFTFVQTIMNVCDTGKWSRSWEDAHAAEYEILLPLYEKNKQQFRELLESGYSVKFITFNGLKSLLKLKFGKLEDQDYKIVDYTIELLELTTQQHESLKQLLSVNWSIEECEREGLDPTSLLVNLKPIVSLPG